MTGPPFTRDFGCWFDWSSGHVCDLVVSSTTFRSTYPYDLARCTLVTTFRQPIRDRNSRPCLLSISLDAARFTDDSRQPTQRARPGTPKVTCDGFLPATSSMIVLFSVQKYFGHMRLGASFMYSSGSGIPVTQMIWYAVDDWFPG